MPVKSLIKKTKKMSRKKLVIIALVAAVVIGGIVYFVFIRKPTITTTPSTSQEEDAEAIKQGNSPKNANSVQSNQSDKQGDSSVSSNQEVIQPSGNFVSNHTITSASDSIESICNTTAGATCEITFAQNGVTKSLGGKTTNKDGTTTWNWTPSSIGLTSGSWNIVAISTYNGKVATQTDPRKLEVTL